MRFRRDLTPYEPDRSGLPVVEVGPAEALSFARIVATGYDLPDETVPWLAEITSTGWLAWLALADGEPAAAAALYVRERGAYFGFAATLPAQRGRGAQNALLSARIERARELGCAWLATETGELREGRPSASYRNLLRCGFVEQTVVANWVGRA
jgi:GNAT superfamily N-acetyltransferase